MVARDDVNMSLPKIIHFSVDMVWSTASPIVKPYDIGYLHLGNT